MARSAKPAKGKKKNKGSVTVNMEGVESGGRSISDGWAKAVIKEAELGESEAGNKMFTLKIAVDNGKQKANVFEHLVMTPNALWKTRTLLEAAGVDVEDGEMTFKADDFVDLEFDAEIINEEFEDKMRPKIGGFAPLGSNTDAEDDDEDDDEEEEDEDDEDDEEEAPKSKKKSSKRKSKDDEDDDEDDDSDDDDSDDDDDDDSDEDDEDDDSDDDDDDEEEDDDEEDDSDDDDDEDDDEDEEEDEKPKSKKKGKKSKPKLRAGTKVKFKTDKGKTITGVITAIDDDTVTVEDGKKVDWELELDEIEVI